MSEPQLTTARLMPRPEILGAVAHLLAVRMAAERDRWMLWFPVGIGVGVGAYFAMDFEPPLWWGPVAAMVAIAGLVYGKTLPEAWRAGVLIAFLSVGMVAVGFTVGQVRTSIIGAPMLGQRLGPTWVEGRVIGVERLPKGARITLDQPDIARLASEDTPLRVRVQLRGEQPSFDVGDRIGVPAILNPPPPPAVPGAFDFQRHAFFLGLGALGFSVGQLKVTAAADGTASRTAGILLHQIRDNVGGRVRDTAGGATGAIMVALLTGERGEIPEPVIKAIRESGLAHLLAISGLHIGLVAGFIFFVVRGLLALVPALALRFPIKKWAAVASVAGAGGYVFLAGATVPSQRAFLMVAFVLLAVLVDRRGISMRLVAWAAALILLLTPETLLGPSFQLSFAAVVALVAAYEIVRERASGIQEAALTVRLWRYFAAVGLSTVVASAATAPFAAYHFNQFTVYGLAANLLAVPLTALWIMPCAVMALVLMPVHLEGLALAPMQWGVEGLIAIADIVAAWRGAVIHVPPMPTWGLVLVAFGGLWLCLWRQSWRLWGVGAVAIGLSAMYFSEPPDILVDGQGKLFSVRTADDRLAFSSYSAAPFSRELWLRRYGEEAGRKTWPRTGLNKDKTLGCDPLGCLYHAKGRVVALVKRPQALHEDCRAADTVISTIPLRQACPSADTVVDRFDMWRDGAHAIWLQPEGVRVQSVNALRGDRPWVIKPKRQASKE